MVISQETMPEKSAKRKASEMLASSENTPANAPDKLSQEDQEENRPTKRPTKADSKAITAANNLSTSAFKEAFIPSQNLLYRASKRAKQAPSTETDTALQDFDITFCKASELTKNQMTQCFNLIESTSRPDYENSASFGWHPRRKRREMREDEMRYLLVYSSPSPHSNTNRDSDGPTDAEQTAGNENQDEAEGELAAFLSFMLTHDSTPSVPVLYIYEIHLCSSTRGIGLGQHLMHLAGSIARNVGVRKVMLTCFVSNSKAMGFYSSLGFERDACSPEERVTRGRTVGVEYVILSREVGGGERGRGERA